MMHGRNIANDEKRLNGDSRILVIGGDHANTLASIRALAHDGIQFDLIIHGASSEHKTMVGASKFAPKPVLINYTFEAIRDGIDTWIGDSLPSNCILLPSSDLAALVIDVCFRPLGVKSSGFVNEDLRVSDLMDKHAQARWATSLGIPVARGIEIDLTGYNEDCPISFPVIIKPAVSAEGEKSDIKICHEYNEYAEAVKYYQNKQYHHALVQELIDYEYEITCVGLIRSDGIPVWRAYSKEIVHPKGRGNIASGHLETDPMVLEKINTVLLILAEQGYRGLCDVEFFKTSKGVMLNEVNFRQSGIVAFPFYEGLFLPSLWAQDMMGHSTTVGIEYPVETYRVVSEAIYLYYVKGSNENIVKWVNALKVKGGKDLLFSGDISPFKTFICDTLKNQIKKFIR